MRYPLGFAGWARELEARCRRILLDLESLGPVRITGNRLPVVLEAEGDLNAILEDSSRGGLLRVLRRPPWQLASASPARVSLERRVQAVAELAAAASAVHDALGRLVDQLDVVNEQFGSLYPSLLASWLAKARLGSNQIVQLRRQTDVDAAQARLRQIAKRLAARRDFTSLAGVALTGWTIANAESMVAAELASACAVALIDRSRLARRGDRERISYEALASHLEAAFRPRVPPPQNLVAYQGALIEELLLQSGRTRQLVARRGADAPIWCAALSAAVDEQARYLVRPSALRTPDLGGETPRSTDGSYSYYLVPIGEDLVLISQRWPSSVRVWNAAISLGDDVQGQIVARRVAADPGLAVRDLKPLFGGIPDQSAWYRMDSRVRVRVIAKFADGWIGRVKRPGTLSQVPTPAWQEESEESSHFRVLVRGKKHASTDDELPRLASEAGVRVGSSFAGFTTDEVRTSIDGHQVAWRRNPNGSGRAAVRGLEAEWSLFCALNSSAGPRARTLVPLTWTGTQQLGKRRPLYRAPLAVYATGTRILDTLLAVDIRWRLLAIGGVARCMRRAHNLGWVLGTIHPAQFVFSAAFTSSAQLAIPQSVLSYAPATCRIGETPVVDLRLVADENRYGRLDAPLLNPFVAAGRLAEPKHDIYSWGVCALEMLATEPLDVGVVFYSDLLEVVRARSRAFSHASLAVRIAEVLAGDGSMERLTRLADAIGAGLGIDPERWLSAL